METNKHVRLDREHGYQTSRDYARLFEIMKTQAVVCFINYSSDFECRDVACTNYSDGLHQVNSRGVGYVYAEVEDLFVSQCKKADLEFIEPSPPKPALRMVTSAACYAVIYPALRNVALAHGYALAIHGSMIRDFDLIAVPWTDQARDPVELIRALKAECAGVFNHSDFDELIPDGTPTTKPHGRKAWSIHLTNDGAFGPYLDIAVMPRVVETASVEEPQK